MAPSDGAWKHPANRNRPAGTSAVVSIRVTPGRGVLVRPAPTRCSFAREPEDRYQRTRLFPQSSPGGCSLRMTIVARPGVWYRTLLVTSSSTMTGAVSLRTRGIEWSATRYRVFRDGLTGNRYEPSGAVGREAALTNDPYGYGSASRSRTTPPSPAGWPVIAPEMSVEALNGISSRPGAADIRVAVAAAGAIAKAPVDARPSAVARRKRPLTGRTVHPPSRALATVPRVDWAGTTSRRKNSC